MRTEQKKCCGHYWLLRSWNESWLGPTQQRCTSGTPSSDWPARIWTEMWARGGSGSKGPTTVGACHRDQPEVTSSSGWQTATRLKPAQLSAPPPNFWFATQIGDHWQMVRTTCLSILKTQRPNGMIKKIEIDCQLIFQLQALRQELIKTYSIRQNYQIKLTCPGLKEITLWQEQTDNEEMFGCGQLQSSWATELTIVLRLEICCRK